MKDKEERGERWSDGVTGRERRENQKMSMRIDLGLEFRGETEKRD